MSSAGGDGVSGAFAKVQGALLAALAAAALAGCSAPQSLNPVDWWHALEGGPIADNRPPPPNADAPYPNLSTVPARPPPPDAKALGRIAVGLVADRRNAQYAAIAQPIPTLPPPPPRPAPAAAGGDEQPNAALQAASAPPAPPAPAAPPPSPPPRPAPVGAVTATPLAPLPPAPAAAMPELPPAAPPPPQLPGVAIAAVTAPTVPAVAPPPPPAPPAPPGAPIAIAFPAGSAVLPAAAAVPLKALAQQRGVRSIAVTGFGEAVSAEPAAQAAALPLGLDRARAVAARLRADGVPEAAIRVSAEPQGGGAAARLVN